MRIAIIGNIAAGKSTLARKLSLQYHIPVTHIDQIQFLPDLTVRPISEVRNELAKIESQNSWIIDGFGPLDMLEPRLRLADQIYWLDEPLHIHIFRLAKRQFLNLFSKRIELSHCQSEWKWTHQKKLWLTLFKVHNQMRPEMLKILNRDEYRIKVVKPK